jgi:ATP-dependent helicase HepA
MSNTESELGLGAVLAENHRTVTVHFPATDDTRVYAKQTAPLTRIAFEPGDNIKSQDGWSLKVISVKEEENLLIYYGTNEQNEETLLIESKLDNFMQLNRPAERLFGGQIDAAKWFELRYQTLRHVNRLAHSELYGLTGCRISLIPHQLYIAHEVASRYAPRVLLADEVGLGKTIEAGMILHQQILTGRAQRIIIIVPETLIHQWLVEMMRRFNLFFSIFDEERCYEIEEAGNVENPFHSEQLILCSLEFLTQNPNRHQQALSGEWDLLVVDEAHHLKWSPEHASQEYNIIETLATQISGVLLLTATPEQLGKESHFARLRLLDPDRFHDFNTDPDRFHDFNTFIQEEKSYEPFANAIDELLDSEILSQPSLNIISDTLSEGDNKSLLSDLQSTNKTDQEKQSSRDELIAHLLDRHGTGRILFRNTRSSVRGFPKRNVLSYPLPFPQAYSNCSNHEKNDPKCLLCPEILFQESNPQQLWIEVDPRVEWLTTKLKELKPNKVLVITANADTALDLAEALRIKEGINAAVFHEGLSIVERDRSAAYFADQEYGSQVLICSEIGSEGRNFQFSHHLVLFDLPINPDLLEQRIGRLDRIGQKEEIQIHVPYFTNSAQHVMFRWYHEALSAFEHTCPAGLSVFKQVEDSLIKALQSASSSLADLDALITTSCKLYNETNTALQKGRDKLLEFNSCRPKIANALKEQAKTEDAKSSPKDYLSSVFDCYGIDMEEHSENCFIIRPSDHMQTASFPGLHSEGMTITFDRNTALGFEDAHYITWEHPLVTGAIDLVSANEYGNTSVTAMKSSRFKPGTVLIESIFMVEAASNIKLQSNRYFPPTTIRVVVDKSGNDFNKVLPHEHINEARISVDSETASRVIRDQQHELKMMVSKCELLISKPAGNILKASHQRGHQLLSKEISRLKALSRVNANVRKEELEYFDEHWKILEKVIDSTTPRLDALRVIVCV